MRYDVFLTGAPEDRELGRQLSAALSQRGFAVFFREEGETGQAAKALEESFLLVVLFSDAANRSAELRKELALADSLNKPVLPVRIEDAEPKGDLLYELTDREWVNLYPDPLSKVSVLATCIQEQIDNLTSIPVADAPAPVSRGFILFGRRDLLWVLGIASVVFVLALDIPIEKPMFVVSSLVQAILAAGFPVFIWRMVTRFVQGNRSLISALPAYLVVSAAYAACAYFGIDYYILNLGLTAEEVASIRVDRIPINITILAFLITVALHVISAIVRRLWRWRRG